MTLVAERLAAARQELLDLGLRNPLLNFRPLKSRGLTIIAEQPAQLFDLLVRQGKPMSFLPLAEAATQDTPADWLPQPDDPTLPPDRHTDEYLQTPYSSPHLQERLLNTELAARTVIDEQGVNILYLALGLLHWRELANDPTIRLAPLILIPVELTREDATSPFRLHYTGADLSENLSLRFKLQVDNELTLPPFPENDRLDVKGYLMSVAAAMPAHFSLDPEAIHLGFFSFTRLTLYHDLDQQHWSESQKPDQHPFLQTILGEPGLIPSLTHHAPRNTQHPSDPPLRHTVLDSDSSQAQAIEAVSQGQNLIIQGPPGTGKSQTITNLIAEAVGEGKTVLFVAEKLAALDVVKRRLDAVGLGDACLELHSHKTSRTLFLAELGRTLSLGQPKETGEFPQQNQWETARDRLNAYHQAINIPIGQSGLTPYQVVGESFEFRVSSFESPITSAESPGAPSPHPPVAPSPSPPLPGLSDLSAREYADLRAWVSTLQTQLQQMGVPAQHPFWGSARYPVTAEHMEQLRQFTRTALAALRAWQAAAATLAHTLHLPPPDNPAQVHALVTAADLLQQAPHLYAIQATDPAWHSQARQILAGLDAAATISRHHQRYDSLLIPEAWNQPVVPIRQALAAGQDRWGRWFAGEYRRGRALLAGLCLQPIPGDWAEQIAVVDAILEVQRLQPALDETEILLARLFTVRWQGAQTDWTALTQVAYWLTNLHQEIHEGRVPVGVLSYLNQPVDKTRLTAPLAQLHEVESAYHRDLQPVLTLLQLRTEFPEFPPVATSSHRPFTTIQTRLHTWHTSANRWLEMARWLELTEEQFEVSSSEFRVVSADQLETRNSKLKTQISELAPTWPDAPTHLLTWFEHRYYTALLERAQAEQPALRDEDAAATLAAALAQFQTLDVAFLEANRYRLATEHWQRLPKHTAIGRVGLLQTEIAKKRAQLPIRTLMSEVGLAIQQIKPIFMMSPLSVATFLPPNDIQFDLIIFDEASQVRPAEAFSAILRGRQVVVVGDSRQLPPTPFFERVLGDPELEPELEEGVWAENERVPESILELSVRQNVAQAWLRWHYRSQHESLIALSNQEFYDNQLVVFPSPDAQRQNSGLIMHHLPDTAYERGTSRTNPQEAQAVAEAVMAHARSRPHLTLGVATFSSAQQKAISQKLELLRRQTPDLEPFFNAHPAEPFFIKNLENVQGDERDIIFISMGYGYTAEKKLALNFGPLNQSGGERRLNVLITRARWRCELFTNFQARNMNLSHTHSDGVKVLRKFLRYAESGTLPELAPVERIAKDGLVEKLAAALQQQNHLVRRVNSGVNLDLAVGDPARPGFDRLALMTDGGQAAQAPSARDRERLQAQVLTGLGWQTHRLWSWGWWQQPEREWGELEEEIKRLGDGEVSSEQLAVTSKQLAILRYDAAALQPRSIPTYVPASLKASLTADRGDWRYEKNTGHFTCQSYHRFDLKTRLFLPQKRTRGNSHYQAQAETNPGLGELYGSLSYAPYGKRFYHSAWFTLFTPDNKMYQLLLDWQTWKFYINTSYVYSDSRHDSRTRYDPISGKLETLLLSHGISVKQLYFEAMTHPTIASEVDDEVKWVVEIAVKEGPIHLDEVSRRLSLATGLTRRSSAVSGVVKSAAAAAHQQKRLRQVGKFLWPAGMTRPPVRSRANLPAVSRSLDLIAPEEIQEAILLVVQDGLGVLPEEIPLAVGQLFGFARLGEFQASFINQQLEPMLADGRLMMSGKWVTIRPDS